MFIHLKRLSDDGIQTTGSMGVYDEMSKLILTLNTLELSWKGNQRKISCIPDGIYKFNIRYSFRFGWCFEIKNVPNRTAILIHAGNFNN